MTNGANDVITMSAFYRKGIKDMRRSQDVRVVYANKEFDENYREVGLTKA